MWAQFRVLSSIHWNLTFKSRTKIAQRRILCYFKQELEWRIAYNRETSWRSLLRNLGIDVRTLAGQLYESYYFPWFSHDRERITIKRRSSFAVLRLYNHISVIISEYIEIIYIKYWIKFTTHTALKRIKLLFAVSFTAMFKIKLNYIPIINICVFLYWQQ